MSKPRPASRNRFLFRRVAALGLIAVVVGAAALIVRESGNEATAGAGVAAGPVAETDTALSSSLTPDRLAGQRTIGGFSGKSIPNGLRRAIRAGRIGGVILFSDNIGPRRQIRKLNRRLQAIPRPAGLRRAPLLITVDQEGGLVKRLAGAPGYSAAQMGARGAAFSRRQGRLTGRNLKNAGFNVDLAPVLDVARAGGNIDLTDRGFGRTPKRVATTGVAFAQGLEATGVAATAKHFPGLGSASLNTDDAVQRIGLPKRKLRRIDMAPYRPFIRSGGELVMVGTAIYPAFGAKPAAFNRRIVTGELRNRLGFRGVTITDAMEATAARAFGGSKKAAVAGARAGMDLLLFGDWREALKGQAAMTAKLRGKRLDRAEFRESVDRVISLRQRLAK